MAPPNYDQLLGQIRLPGLTLDEHTVAMRWLREKGMLYDAIDFNVQLGPIPHFEFDMTPEQRKQAEYLYSTKADIVARHAGVVTIIEVKKRVTKSALGQLAHYAYWYREKHPEDKEIVLRIIGEWADEGIAKSTLANGVDIELYGEPA